MFQVVSIDYNSVSNYLVQRVVVKRILTSSLMFRKLCLGQKMRIIKSTHKAEYNYEELYKK